MKEEYQITLLQGMEGRVFNGAQNKGNKEAFLALFNHTGGGKPSPEFSFERAFLHY
jgi:hypothetical protein